MRQQIIVVLARGYYGVIMILIDVLWNVVTVYGMSQYKKIPPHVRSTVSRT